MPLIKNGAEIDDIWAYVDGEAELSEGGCFTVPLARFLAEASTLAERNTQVGVRLAPDDDAALLKASCARWATSCGISYSI